MMMMIVVGISHLLIRYIIGPKNREIYEREPQVGYLPPQLESNWTTANSHEFDYNPTKVYPCARCDLIIV